MAVMDSYDGTPDPTPSPTPGLTPDLTPTPSLDALREPFMPVPPSSPDGPLPSAIHTGESITPTGTASSSRPFRGRWLAGVLAISMVSAVVGRLGPSGS